MQACGWNVIDVHDGSSDIIGITRALVTARASQDKPTFVNVRTIIGIGSSIAGDAKAHGAAFGASEVINIKKKFGLDPEEHFYLSNDIKDFFKEIQVRGKSYQREWNQKLEQYSTAHPELAKEFKLRVEGKPSKDWRALIPAKKDLPTSSTPARKSAGVVCNELAANLNNFMVGTADLTPSVNMSWKGQVDFQSVCIIKSRREHCSLTSSILARPENNMWAHRGL